MAMDGVARPAVCHHHNSETRIELKRFCPSPTALDRLEARYSKGAELQERLNPSIDCCP